MELSDLILFLHQPPSLLFLLHSPGLKPYLRIKPSSNSPDDYTLFRPRETPVEFIGHDLGFPFHPRCHIDGLDFPFDSHFSCVDVIHGVVCVSHHALNHTVLWNPAIRKYIDLPIAYLDYCRAIGFGYHSSNNDFIVVPIRIPDFAYEVYTVRDGFWRVGTIDCNGIKTYGHTSDATGRTGCFVNGTIHWLIATPDHEAHALLMFDCEHEEFMTMELPEEMAYSQYRPRFLIELELLKYADRLSALVVMDHIVLRVMEEHTWKKLYSISNNYIHTYIPSLVKLSPYGSDQWIEFLQINGWTSMFSEILSRHVYEESLCLMDHP